MATNSIQTTVQASQMTVYHILIFRSATTNTPPQIFKKSPEKTDTVTYLILQKPLFHHTPINRIHK